VLGALTLLAAMIARNTLSYKRFRIAAIQWLLPNKLANFSNLRPANQILIFVADPPFVRSEMRIPPLKVRTYKARELLLARHVGEA
jgi:hypothetical protein